jgi:hypothetical protein
MNYPQSQRLADLLGIPLHKSCLLRKLRSYGVDTPEKLIALAAQRGCYHYQTAMMVHQVPKQLCGNEELAVALLSPNNFYNPRLVRAGAQLLSGADIGFERLVREAVKERCGEVLLHVVMAGQRLEPQNPSWNKLSELISKAFKRLRHVEPGVLPADGRFCAETGFIGRKRTKQVIQRWLRPMRTES